MPKSTIEALLQNKKNDLTDDAVVAVMDKLSLLAIAKKPFDGKAEIAINGFRLSIDCTGNPIFMKDYGGKNNG